MDQMSLKLLENSPALFSMVLIVVMFLRHLKESEVDNKTFQKDMMTSHAKRTDEFITTVKEINEEASKRSDQYQTHLIRNTEVGVQNTAELSKLTAEVSRMVDRLKGS